MHILYIAIAFIHLYKIQILNEQLFSSRTQYMPLDRKLINDITY